MEPRNAIVTGASHGIGQYIARALAARQMNLLLVARSEAELARLAGELGGAIKVSAAAIDLGGPQAAQQVADAAAALGSVDVLVNNAATEPQTRFHVLTPAEIEHVLQVDLISPLLLARLLLPGMLQRGYGRIVNVSSLAGHTSFPYTEAYAAAKDGLTAFSRVLHSDYRAAFSVSPQKVAAAILRAIDTPKPEMVISVGPGRALKALMDYFPALGPALNRLSGADKLMTAVADHREAARTNPAQRNNAQPT